MIFEKGHSRHPGGPVDQREVTIKYQLKPRNEPGGLHPIKNVSTEKIHNINPEDFLIIFKDCRNARSSMRMVTPTFFCLGPFAHENSPGWTVLCTCPFYEFICLEKLESVDPMAIMIEPCSNQQREGREWGNSIRLDHGVWQTHMTRRRKAPFLCLTPLKHDRET